MIDIDHILMDAAIFILGVAFGITIVNIMEKFL